MRLLVAASAAHPRRNAGRSLASLCMLLVSLLLLSVSLASFVSATDDVLPDPTQFSPVIDVQPIDTLRTNGLPVAQGFFGASAQGVKRTSMCRLLNPAFYPQADGTKYPDNGLFTCAEDPADTNVCLSRQDVVDAFAGQPDVLASLYSRYDLPPVHIESMDSNANYFTTQVFSLLAQEVGGYRVKFTVNPTFSTSVFRCTGNQFDFSAEVWRTDWKDAQWNAAFLGTDPNTPQTCSYDGINGQTIFNGWFVDTYSVITAANNTLPGEQPMSLDFWRAYATAEGVAGLPQFNTTEAKVEIAKNPGVPLYEFPEWCDQDIPGWVPCGMIYPVAPFFEVGVVLAQIKNLKLRLAVYYAPLTNGFDVFYGLIIPRIKNRQHVLTMLGNNAGLVANEYFRHVMLPTVTPACLESYDTGNVANYNCDMRTQVLGKVSNRGIRAKSDYNDATTLFSRMQFTGQIVYDALTKITDTNLPVDQACTWIKQNTKLWTPWFGTTTPRVHTIELTAGVGDAIIAISAIFMASTIAGMIFLFKYRSHPIIRRASHLFCQFMLAGAALFYATLIVGVQKESFGTCTAAQFMFSVAFTLFYGSLLVKTWRIYLIFNSKALEVQKLPDSTMTLYLLIYGAVDLLLVILWAGISPPTATLHDHSTAAYTQVTLCDSEHSVVFSTALYVWRGLAVLAGGVLAVRIRGVDDDFSESKFLGAACYNILGVSIVVLGLTLVGSRAPDVAAVSWLIGVTLAVFLSSLIFLVPKWQGVFGTQTKVRNNTGTGRGTKVSDNLTHLGSDNDTSAGMLRPSGGVKIPLTVKIHTGLQRAPASDGGNSKPGTPVGGATVGTKPGTPVNGSSTKPNTPLAVPSPSGSPVGFPRANTYMQPSSRAEGGPSELQD